MSSSKVGTARKLRYSRRTQSLELKEDAAFDQSAAAATIANLASDHETQYMCYAPGQEEDDDNDRAVSSTELAATTKAQLAPRACTSVTTVLQARKRRGPPRRSASCAAKPEGVKSLRLKVKARAVRLYSKPLNRLRDSHECQLGPGLGALVSVAGDSGKYTLPNVTAPVSRQRRLPPPLSPTTPLVGSKLSLAAETIFSRSVPKRG